MTALGFPDWLENARQERGLDNRRLMISMGMNWETVRALSTGARRPSMWVCCRLAQALGCAPEEVLAAAGFL